MPQELSHFISNPALQTASEITSATNDHSGSYGSILSISETDNRGYSDQKREEIRRKTEANLGPESKAWQEQMGDRLYMSKELKVYFREAFGIDRRVLQG